MKMNIQHGDESVLNNVTVISVIRRKLAKRLQSIVWPENFKSKTAPNPGTGCWNWTGSTHHTPGFPQYAYGVYAANGTPDSTVGAHRFAYEFAYGPLLLDQLDVDHICQNKLCVNPLHLRAITHQDNCRLRRKRQRVTGSVRWKRERGIS